MQQYMIVTLIITLKCAMFVMSCKKKISDTEYVMSQSTFLQDKVIFVCLILTNYHKTFIIMSTLSDISISII